MIRTDELEIWNLTHGGSVVAGAQRVFNIVGNVREPERLASLVYCLNGDHCVEVFVRRSVAYEGGRLWKNGDFNIDTIDRADLLQENEIEFILTQESGRTESTRVRFTVGSPRETGPSFELELSEVTSAEQVGQVVDGRWSLGGVEGRRYLEIAPADAGYDRIVLFGSDARTTDYEVRARLEPTAWTSRYHNLGLVFKWNPHRTGDGSSLPTVWTTGLGYYCSYTPGLRLRFGQEVHVDERGEKVGDTVLAEHPYSPMRRWMYLATGRARVPGIISQLPVGQSYDFRLRVSPSLYSLTVWSAGTVEPPPQLMVHEPDELLQRGAVGVIALCCGVRVHRFDVSPL